MKRKSLIQLKSEIKHAAQDYYAGKPKLTDAQFDNLVDELKAVKPDDSLLTTVGWGFDVNKLNGDKVNHLYGVVGSLGKIHKVSEIPAAMEDKLVASSKLDGASCVAYYKDGKFIHAVTRGNGTTGIIKDAQFLKIIEKYKLDLQDFTGGIRGEIVMSNHSWEIYKEKYPDAKFPRNVATGLFMRDDVSEDLQYVDFVTYKVMGSENKKFTSYTEILGFLADCGFKVVDSIWIEKSISEWGMEHIFSSWSTYPMDGIVLQGQIKQNADGCIIYKDIAYKFQAEIKETTVIGVEWNLSKNNIMVPIVNIEPVELSGATVSRTSGFNYKYILENNIGKGTRIKICRSNEVIPYITEVIESTTADIPFCCPVCGNPLTTDGTELLCENEDCPNIEKSRLFSWIKVIGVKDLLGIGDAFLEDLYAVMQKYFNRKNITVEDLYAQNGFLPLINHENFENILKNFTPSAAEKLSKLLYNLHGVESFGDLIYACNIRGLGKTICDKIAPILYEWYTTNDVKVLSEISKIPGLGVTVENTVKNALKVFARLFYLIPVQFVKFPPLNASQTKIMITGALSVSRKQFENECKAKNIVVSSSITDCKYLVTNETNSESSKMKKAKQHGIEIISENDFRKLYEL